MEVFAGFLSHTDHHIGRLMDYLRETGELDNTIVMLVSDNGASPEGGPTGTTNEMQFFNNAPEPLEDSVKAIDELGGPTAFNHYPWGWTWAGNTPFRRWKRETYRGGTTDPFIVHWPAGHARAAARSATTTPTSSTWSRRSSTRSGSSRRPRIRGVTQSPIHGVSFLHTFDDAAAATLHRTQYFEMFGHRAIDHDGWRAVCPWPGPSFAEAGDIKFGTPITAEMLGRLDSDGWELYHVADDPAENRNLAGEHRDKLIELISLWYVQAGKYDVLPIDGSALQRMMVVRPEVAETRDTVHVPARHPDGAVLRRPARS